MISRNVQRYDPLGTTTVVVPVLTAAATYAFHPDRNTLAGSGVATKATVSMVMRLARVDGLFCLFFYRSKVWGPTLCEKNLRGVGETLEIYKIPFRV